MIEKRNFINLTNKKINNCHTHFTHFAKPKWQTILEQKTIKLPQEVALSKALDKCGGQQSVDSTVCPLPVQQSVHLL